MASMRIRWIFLMRINKLGRCRMTADPLRHGMSEQSLSAMQKTEMQILINQTLVDTRYYKMVKYAYNNLD